MITVPARIDNFLVLKANTAVIAGNEVALATLADAAFEVAW